MANKGEAKAAFAAEAGRMGHRHKLSNQLTALHCQMDVLVSGTIIKSMHAPSTWLFLAAGFKGGSINPALAVG